MKLLSIAATFLIATSIARAGLHWTLQECEKQYGPPITGEWTDELGRAVFALNRRGYSNYAYLLDGSGYGASHRVLSSTRGGLRSRPWLFGTPSITLGSITEWPQSLV